MDITGLPETFQWALPSNVLLNVLKHLSLAELCTAGQVCWTWNGVVGSDTLWSSILEDQYGCSMPVDASNSCRHSLLQLRTSSLWATGNLQADTTCVTPGLLSPPSVVIPLSVSGTELSELWSAQQARSVSSSACAEGPTRGPFFEHKCKLPQDFAVSPLAAGSSHLVLLGSHGRVVDTRGAFVKQSQPEAAQQRDAATKLLAWLLKQQGQGHPGTATTDSDQHWDAVVGRLREGYNISMRNPWLPPGGAVITRVASGDGHVLAVAADGRVWGWGKNEAGQLGLGSCTAWQATPTDITAALDGAWKGEGERVVLAACGTSHSVLLMDSGAVYTAGCNSSGQCGQDLQLNECPVFCQPQLASEAAELSHSTHSHTPGSSPTQQQLRSTSSTDSNELSTLRDIISAAPAASTVRQASLPPAAAIAAGPGNTLAATRAGRVLVCGASSSGQCGSAWLKAAVCPGFVDVGPEVGWHGLLRPSADQVAAAGGQLANALAKVVEVAAGDGTCYALTDAGEVFAWGQGSKGQLGTGGCPKVQATPAKSPWARQIRHVSASPTGQFAAAVDTAGKLYTWGAGKWGQLGHGDTSKRTVGRLVKHLRHLDVLQVQCCAESMLVLTAQHIPHLLQHQHQHPQHSAADVSTDAATSAQQQPQQHRKQKKRQGRAAKQASSAPDAADSFPANPSTSPPGRTGSSSKHTRRSRQQERMAAAAAQAGCDSTEPDSIADIVTEQLSGHMSMRGVGWEDVDGQGPYFCPAPKPDRASSSRCAAAGDPDEPYSQSPSSSSSRMRRAGSSSSRASAGASSGSSPGPRHPRMDKGFKRLLKRLLTGFMTDSSQREMTFPASLSAADRYHVHVAAEAYGLAHASHNQGSDRVMKVWKVSRTRKSPAYDDLGYGST